MKTYPHDILTKSPSRGWGWLRKVFGLGLVFCDNIESIRQFLQRLTGTDLFSPEIYYLSQIPAQMDWRETLSIVVISLALSLAATLYPSWRAARTDPVEALRYE